MAERSARLSLNTQDITNEFFDETRLIGIMAPVKDYQFCWHLNNTLGLDFRINNDIEIQLQKTRAYFFPVYEYCEPTGSLAHFVYNNECDGEYLLPEFKHLDFLWLMKYDTVDDETFQTIIHSIRSINGVQLVNELSIDKIKNKEHLVF